jgi:hypothetical protein
MSEQLTFHRGGTNPDTSLEADRPKAEVGAARAATDHDASYLRVFVFALFFFFGGITSLNDVIIPKLKELFTLSYAEVMTVQSAFFGAYFIISLPAAAVVRRIGYMRSAVVGLLLMMIGCLLFIPASSSALFQMFLIALFIVAAGITVVQVVAILRGSLQRFCAAWQSRPSPARAARRCGGWPQWRCAFGRAEGVSLSLASARLQWRAVILRPCVGKWSKRANSRQTIRVDARWTLYRDGVYWDCYIKPTPPQSCDA